MSISWWVDKQNVVCSYSEIIFSHKREQSTDGSYNMHGKHYAKRKKPVTKDHVLYDPIYRKCLWSEVAQSCLTLCDPMDCSLPGSSIHEILQARVLEWVAIAFSDRKCLD